MFGGSGRPRQRSCRKLGLASLPMSLGANGIEFVAVGALLVVAAAVYLAFLATRRLIRPTARTQEAEQRRFTRNAIAPMVTGFVDRALFWAFWIVVLRRIGPGGNGDYAFAANLLAYFAVVVDFGLGTLVTRDVARDAAGLQRIFRTALALRMRLLAVSMPVMVGIALIYWATGTIDGRALLTTGVLALGLPLAAVNQAYAAVYDAWERIDRRALVVAGTSALTVGLGLVLLAAGLGVVGIALAGLISSGVTLIALGRPVGFGLLRQSVGTQRDDLRQLVRHALPLMLNSLLATAFIQIDILILQALQGTAVVGHYNAAYKFLNAMNVLPAAVVLAAFPLMARAAGNPAELARWFTRAWRVLVTAAAGLVVLFFIFAEPWIDTLLGPEFLPETAIALAILIWFLPLSYLNGTLQYVVIASDRQAKLTPAFLVATLVNLGMNLALVPIWGFAAAAATTIGSEVVLLAGLGWILRKDRLLRRVLEPAARPVLAAGAAAAVALLLRDLVWIAAALAAMATYVVALIAIGGLRPSAIRDVVRSL